MHVSKAAINLNRLLLIAWTESRENVVPTIAEVSFCYEIDISLIIILILIKINFLSIHTIEKQIQL